MPATDGAFESIYRNDVGRGSAPPAGAAFLGSVNITNAPGINARNAQYLSRM
ncbi:hypothetical protein ACGFX2_14325 [Streptomyces goshikiensis]|uniref:hypothetical protein n=1 Tax=Streptomyces goshikiensis TaxID=1942 RepID=UPI00371059AA